MAEPLTDLSQMPFGKFRGTPMQDVPADYLFWLFQNGMKKDTDKSPVAEYIRKSIHAFQLEEPDLIWT